MYLAMLKNACNTANYQRINFLPGVKWNKKIMKKSKILLVIGYQFVLHISFILLKNYH